MPVEELTEGDALLVDGEWLTIVAEEPANPGWVRFNTGGRRVVRMRIGEIVQARFDD